MAYCYWSLHYVTYISKEKLHNRSLDLIYKISDTLIQNIFSFSKTYIQLWLWAQNVFLTYSVAELGSPSNNKRGSLGIFTRLLWYHKHIWRKTADTTTPKVYYSKIIFYANLKKPLLSSASRFSIIYNYVHLSLIILASPCPLSFLNYNAI